MANRNAHPETLIHRAVKQENHVSSQSNLQVGPEETKQSIEYLHHWTRTLPIFLVGLVLSCQLAVYLDDYFDGDRKPEFTSPYVLYIHIDIVV